MPDNTPQWTLGQYIEFALRISGSSSSVGPVDEGSHEPTTPVEPEFCYTSPYSRYVLAEFPEPCRFSADLPEPCRFSADLPEPRHFSADLPEPRHFSADLPEPRHFSADLPEPRHFSADLPEPRYVSADRPEPHYVLAEFPEPSTVERAFPETVPVTPAISIQSPVTSQQIFQIGLLSSRTGIQCGRFPAEVSTCCHKGHRAGVSSR
ncbi:hypothetical protein PO909_008585 [Leuciscus waleckii]